ncbi:hypothetical protein [Arthrobacter sp. H35-D1]|nr:hypothetical protein [Arthrobacter sp. H35-D1]MDJ0312506.1 hypothetical protein [Arthrobacter sp. H35-D1]
MTDLFDWLAAPYVAANLITGIAAAAFLALLVGIVVKMRQR